MVQTNMFRKMKSYKMVMKGWSIAAALIKRLSKLCVKHGLQTVSCERDIWLKSQFLLAEAMNLGTFMSCKDVETMRVLINRLHGEFDRTTKSIEFGERHGDSYALLLSLQDLRNRELEFLKLLEDLERQIYVCNATISKTNAG
ncbi:hypothetical protein SUGI_0817720 [Cryptomeria japonica]|nr:hypothetical protein SUGI_0817720 [Cryptomeria japonica]